MGGIRASWVGVLVLAWFALGPASGQGLTITEFMSQNRSVLQDEDGDYPDWIEVLNASSGEVSLDGWFLTDDHDDLRKWKFPAVSLPSGGFLMVFASEKDRAIAGSELHTNFALDDAGEYLALVAPDGTTVVSEFTPVYPRQVMDVACGHPLITEEATVLATGAPAKYLVPVDSSLLATWTAPAFDDAAWSEGGMPLGFDRKSSPTYADQIQTDLGTAMASVNATVYTRIRFTVADPAAFDAWRLRVRYDDGFVAYLNGKEVLRKNCPSVLAWNTRASTRRAEATVLVPEEYNFVPPPGLVSSGENVLAVHGLNYTKTDTDFFLSLELIGVRILGVSTEKVEYFGAPTPGWANSGGARGVASRPQISPPGGSFTAAFALSLSTTVPDGIVRFTLDRSEPTEASAPYAEPIQIQSTTVVKAKTFAPGLVPSPTVVGSYFVIDPTLGSWSSNLPVMVVETFGAAVSGGVTYTPAYAMSLEPPQGGRTTWSVPPAWQGRAGIKIRGSSSRGFPKNNFTFELRDELDMDIDASLLGLPPHSDWVLYGPYTDKSLMRDYLAYSWSNKIGRYAPRARFIELFLSVSKSPSIRNAQYHGVYVLMERIRRDPNRVDVERMYRSLTGPEDVAGGYILKIDRLGPGETGFTTQRGRPLVYVYPREDEISPAQKTYIKGFMDQFEAALYGSKYTDPEVGYAKYIDADSFIDHHILTELCKNIDGYRLSTFMHKSRDGKLTFGPLWDFNLSLGNANYLDGWKPDGWYYSLVSGNDYSWFPRLFQDPAFKERYRQRWLQLRASHFRTQDLISEIDATAQYLDEAQGRNFKRWPTLGTYIWPNWFIAKTYAEEIGFMRGWLEARLAWMDSTFIPTPTFSPAGGNIAEGTQVEIHASDGTIYYTVDGTDPMGAVGSDPAPGAIEYTGPIAVTSNVRITARVRSGGSWGGSKAATFVVRLMPLVITEIMARPPDPPAGSPYVADDFEFVELQNIGEEPLDLQGARFTTGVTFEFAGSAVTSLSPGEHVVIVKNLEAFATRYDTASMKVAGEYGRILSDRRTLLHLVGPLDESLQRFTYDTSWYPPTAGEGYSLVIRDPTGPRDSWGTPEAWRASSQVGGSPGRADPDGPVGGLQRPGDANQDGRLDVSDAVVLLLHLFQGGALVLPCDGASVGEGGNLKLFDINADGEVDSSDPIGILTYYFLRGQPPALGSECVAIEGCREACVR